MKDFIVIDGVDLGFLRLHAHSIADRTFTSPLVRVRYSIEDGIIKWKVNEGMWSAGIGRLANEEGY